ncbi:hypothetical protein GF359_10430 [candidate division WOR-3 bacterium]|uniref:DUF8091 domain-containing protein n=1 Tax=candidate division WOR-3 bacterium TaxID=2052148 RepID=A0A9D5KAQ2_UNCW3|nr:hypothetical protein [candidate division WOR-3 bacterium]MBD3365617.1 hypothetical protein [candidate division WOR-3 bacterium]
MPISDGIGSMNESSLHLGIKDWYSRPGDRFEVKIEGSVIDIVRGPLLIEIQTRNFSSIRRKLEKLIDYHKILVLYPIPAQTWIIRVSETGKVLSRRRSPKKGKLIHVFDELLHIPEMINHPNFSIEVLMIRMEEIRCADGKGSWRRRGVSIKDRRLLKVTESHRFTRGQDFLRFIPDSLETPFTNSDFARASGYSIYQTRRITYTLRRMGVLKVEGKRGNAFEFKVAI